MGRKRVNSLRRKELPSCRTTLSGLSILLLMMVVIGFSTTGCTNGEQQAQTPDTTPQVQTRHREKRKLELEETQTATNMVSYDVTSVGRQDPFMPYGEVAAYTEARNSAYAEANKHNAEIARIMKMKNTAIREQDDISPYSFNLPVPPTSLNSGDAAAVRITKTKVVGIMYSETSPTAIINVEGQDYLVRPGDKIIGEEYKIIKINPNWITVGFGSNVYSAAIGELFSKDDITKTNNDIYNLKNRFGGRKG